MPIFDLQCNSCCYKFERIFSGYDAPLGKCPKCGGAVRKVYHNAALVLFSGEGWYATEHGNQRHNCLGVHDSYDEEDSCIDENEFFQ